MGIQTLWGIRSMVAINSLGFFALAFSIAAMHPKVRACLNGNKRGAVEEEEEDKKKKDPALNADTNNKNNTKVTPSALPPENELEAVRGWSQVDHGNSSSANTR